MNRVIRFLKLLNARQKVDRETLYTAVTFSVPVYLFVFYPGTLLEKIAAAGVALSTLLILIGVLLFTLLMLGEPIARGVKIVRDTWRESGEKQKRDAAQSDWKKRALRHAHLKKYSNCGALYETAPQYKKIKCERCQDAKRVKCPDCNGYSSLDPDNYCGRCKATHEIECKKCKPLRPGTLTIRKG